MVCPFVYVPVELIYASAYALDWVFFRVLSRCQKDDPVLLALAQRAGEMPELGGVVSVDEDDVHCHSLVHRLFSSVKIGIIGFL